MKTVIPGWQKYNIKAVKLSRLVFLFLIFFITAPSFSQVDGCKDPMATNYNAAATENNGTCTYSPTNYRPRVKVNPISDSLLETSGLQFVGNSLWSFNDGGHKGSGLIYRIDTLTKKVLQTVTLAGAGTNDWEDIAFDGTYMYIGDFGNNFNGARTDLKIYKFPYDEIPAYGLVPNAVVPADKIEVIHFTYEDQPQPPVAVPANTTKFDCEAMIVDSGKIHLFTKNWVDNNSIHYIISNLLAGSYVATPIDTLETNYLVTAADKVAGKNIAVLLGYQPTGFGTHYMHVLSDFRDGRYFNGNKRKIKLRSALEMGQAEGITFRNETYGYISNESINKAGIMQRLRTFSIIDWVPEYVLHESRTRLKATKEKKVYR
jgi:hypothetical protein